MRRDDAKAPGLPEGDVHKGDVLDRFLPAVADWFRARLGRPTPAQQLGWQAIADGHRTLIVAPTGSGKTLAAFLVGLDHLWRHPDIRPGRGVRVLYISPLKALGLDISRNLREPLTEILEISGQKAMPLRPLRLGVRSGDTPVEERRRLLRHPPEILVTTPESLHLMLTSRARDILRGVEYVIVDEIHALCGNKRGVFLSVLLERLESQNPAGFVRIGLSATQRPLDEAARYLGGFRKVSGRGPSARFEPRPVRIVDAGQQKELDLAVELPGGVAGPGGSVWPAIAQRLLELVGPHRSTIIFANNRRVVERLAAALNDRAAEAAATEHVESVPPTPIARPHHGSLSPEARRSTEDLLKRGELAAVVATASLELGIDMGAVELACQVESPGGIARALQRVGRAGHIVGETSRGRLLAKSRGDLLESAALVRAMLAGEVEHLRVPTNCLDVLAQQIVACVAEGPQNAHDVFDLMRQAYPYRDLPPSAFEDVLAMVSGRFGMECFRDLTPRLSWDCVHNILHPLPGSAHHALVGGGTIPDTGQYPLYLGENGPRLGELDEEFVLERRAGESFRLGHGTWRIERIDPDRVIVAPAGGASSLVPFWRGEGAGRSAELAAAVGALARELSARCAEPSEAEAWLADECRMTPDAARALVGYIRRQQQRAGVVPDDRRVLVESYRDQAGETGLAVLTTLGSKLNHALKLVVQARLRQRFGIDVAALHGDEGLLLRLPGMDDPPLDLLDDLTPDAAENLLRGALGDSALFGLRFRQNASRALLMPRPDPSRRTPLWLQRLRARDLLQVARGHANFPIVAETYRECLDDDLDRPGLRRFLEAIASGRVQVHKRRGEEPSPFASELIFRFELTYLDEWDQPRRGDHPVDPQLDDRRIDELLARPDLDPDAIARVDRRLRGVNRPPRTAEEMAERLRRVGDLTPEEIAGPMDAFLQSLEVSGRARRIVLPGTAHPCLWIAAEEGPLYESAFGTGLADRETSRASVVRRFIETRVLVGLDELLARYPLEAADATEILEALEAEQLVRRIDAEGDQGVWADRRNLLEARQLTLVLRRREAVAVSPELYADFVLGLQHAKPGTGLEGEPGLELILEQLAGLAAPLELWESEILPRRLRGFRPAWLDSAISTGRWTWRSLDEGRSGARRLAFVPRDFAGAWPPPDEAPSVASPADRVATFLEGRGACFIEEIARGVSLSMAATSQALGVLLVQGRIVADRLDPLRTGAPLAEHALAGVDGTRRPGRPKLGSLCRVSTSRSLPRWSLATDSNASEVDPEASKLAWASALLARYGVLCRETTRLDPWAPAWRELTGVLARAELRGEVRRGYFVEGLSGIQYALPDVAEALARDRTARPTGGASAPILINSLDPANLFGGGAPFDISLLDGGTARLPRLAGNSLVLAGGRPILIVESHGRRLTGLPSASVEELRAAVALLPTLANSSRRILRVETYNGLAGATSPAASWLAEAGFVRDAPGMAYYAGW
jgi:ATP-dependent Lhr-like helicase